MSKFLMNESTKATLKLILSLVASTVAVALVAIQASGVDDLSVFKRPSVWLPIIGALAVNLTTSLTKSPSQGAAMDAERSLVAEAKAVDKVEAIADIKIRGLVDAGQLAVVGKGDAP